MGGPGEIGSHGCQAVGTLGKHLKVVPRRLDHLLKNLKNETIGNLGMKKIAHGTNEDAPGSAPGQGETQKLRMASDFKSTGVCS
jgi:hypothetical protein